MKSIGEAIQFLHAINIAHRDVKVCIASLYRYTVGEYVSEVHVTLLISLIFPAA